jgi:hypothetical protein
MRKLQHPMGGKVEGTCVILSCMPEAHAHARCDVAWQDSISHTHSNEQVRYDIVTAATEHIEVARISFQTRMNIPSANRVTKIFATEACTGANNRAATNWAR